MYYVGTHTRISQVHEFGQNWHTPINGHFDREIIMFGFEANTTFSDTALRPTRSWSLGQMSMIATAVGCGASGLALEKIGMDFHLTLD